jgi:protocatechuate 3,4-dioxygenase beta subunit
MASDPSPTNRTRPTRRAFLQWTGMAALGMTGLAACGSDSESDPGGPDPDSSSSPDTGSPAASPATGSDGTTGTGASTPPPSLPTLTAAEFERLGTCKLTPTKIAGPTAIAEQLVRRDMSEGRPGQPMRLGLRVLDGSCRPVDGAAVEVWHADVAGDYSAVHDTGGRKDEGPGTTFLRGTQTSGADGIVEFLTIVPGWYRTRAVHVHVRVHLQDRTVLTSQLFFDDGFIRAAFAQPPYLENGLPDTFLAQDGQAGNAAGAGIVFHTEPAPTDNGPGTLALLNLSAKLAGGSPGV